MTNVLTAPFSIAHSVAVKVYAKLTIALVVLIACFVIAGYVNALGYKEAIFAFFFLGGFLILFLGFIPKLQFYAFLAGASDASLRDTDISQGSLKGVNKLYEIVLSVLFWFWVVSGFLATWSFEHSPYAMIPVFAAALVLVARDAHYGLISRKFTIALVTIYASVILFIFLFSTFAPNTQDKVSAMFPAWVTCTADSTRTVTDCASTTSNHVSAPEGFVSNLKCGETSKFYVSSTSWTPELVLNKPPSGKKCFANFAYRDSDGVLSIMANGKYIIERWSPGERLDFGPEVTKLNSLKFKRIAGDPVLLTIKHKFGISDY